MVFFEFALVRRGFVYEKLGIPKPFLSEEQWQRIAPLLPTPHSRGPPFAANRRVLEAILWVLCSGGALAGSPPLISQRLDLLAVPARLGGIRRLVAPVAHVYFRTGTKAPLALFGIFYFWVALR